MVVQMDARAHAPYEAQAKVFKAMAHPTRLFILHELARAGEKCVCELTEMIGVDMSTVSRHLAVLKGVGIVQDEKRGSMVYYRLRLKCVPQFFDCVESVMKCNAENQQRLLS